MREKQKLYLKTSINSAIVDILHQVENERKNLNSSLTEILNVVEKGMDAMYQTGYENGADDMATAFEKRSHA